MFFQWFNQITCKISSIFSQDVRKGSLTFFDQIIVSLSNFLTGIIISHLCSKDQLGLYILGFSIVLIVIEIQNRLITTPYMVYSPSKKNESLYSYSGSTLIHNFGLSLLTTLFLCLAAGCMSLFSKDKGLIIVIFSLSGTIIFILLRDYIRKILFAQLQFYKVLIFDLFVAICQFFGLIFLGYLGMLSAWSSYLAIGTACGVVAISWLLLMRKSFKLILSQSLVDFKDNWSFGKWLLAGNIAYMGSTQLYPWLLTTFHGTSATGVLAACFGVISLANPFLLALGNFFLPQAVHIFDENGIAELNNFLIKATVFISLGMGIFSLMIFKYGEHIIVLFYGHNYGGNGLVLFILAVGSFLAAVTLPIDLGLLVLDRPDANFKFNITALISTITLGLWMVKSFGVLGVAYGILVGNFIVSLLRYLIFMNTVRTISIYGKINANKAIRFDAN